jgi:exodeoxyribonuclease III
MIVASVYLPNGNPRPSANFDYKLRWFERLIAYTATLSKARRPVVLAGDFNVVPTDRDIYNAWAWREDAVMQPEVRDAYRRLLAQGWLDAIPTLHPDPVLYTFWVNAEAHRRGKGFRMDFLLLNRVFARRLRSAGVDAHVRGLRGASDHAPAWITVDA